MITPTQICIVIPSFSEGQRLKKTLVGIRKVLPKIPIIVVDDGSTPPEELVGTNNTTLIRHQLNLGKGASLKTGIEYAYSHGFMAVIMMDADGQHDPVHLPEFVKQLSKHHHDIVFGTRSRTLDVPLTRYLGNKLVALIIRRLFGVYVIDILSGYRAITKKAYSRIRWDSSRYGVETEMVARLGKVKEKLSWTEIPINTIYIDKYKGVTFMDGLKILINSLWWKLS